MVINHGSACRLLPAAGSHFISWRFVFFYKTRTCLFDPFSCISPSVRCSRKNSLRFLFENSQQLSKTTHRFVLWWKIHLLMSICLALFLFLRAHVDMIAVLFQLRHSVKWALNSVEVFLQSYNQSLLCWFCSWLTEEQRVLRAADHEPKCPEAVFPFLVQFLG